MPLPSDNPVIIDTANEISDFLRTVIADICRIPKDSVPNHEPLISLGISSLIAVTISARLEKEFNIEMPYDKIAHNATLSDLASIIAEQLKPQQKPQSLELNRQAIPALTRGMYDIRVLAQYKKLTVQKALFRKAQVEVPFHRCFHSSSTDTIQLEHRTLINFASYNYLGYNHDPRVNDSAEQAIRRFGTSASSSRIVCGEKSIHRELESAIARLYNVDNALALVSGYGTNVSIITHLLDKNDLIIHDSLAHNSIVMGATYSNAKRLKFPHNDLDALEEILSKNRLYYERVLIAVEGLYSMDGDTVPIARLVELKKKYHCLLMVDEAHSIGVLGANGLGIREHGNIAAQDVDIWMGTLSKSFAGCGGYIAGCEELIDYLKFTLPGYIFSVGISPPMAAASLRAIELLQQGNDRVQKLQENSQFFLALAKQYQMNTGLAEGYAIISVIIGHSLECARLANQLFYDGINVQPIIYPGVNESSARLRFFISALHSEEQITHALTVLDRYLACP